VVVVVNLIFNDCFYVFDFLHGLFYMFDFVKVLFGNVQQAGLVEFGLNFDDLPFGAERVPPLDQGVFQDS